MLYVNHIAEILPLLPSCGVIVIDGLNGSGKTTLSQKLRDLTKAALFSLDLYRKGPSERLEDYASIIDYDKLINHFSNNKSPIRIFEGIFVHDVLSIAGIHAAFSIFCSSYSRYENSNRFPYRDVSIMSDDTSMAYNTYFRKRGLPESADIFYAWMSSD